VEDAGMTGKHGSEQKKSIATVRFYAELNDFLPTVRRGREFELTFASPAPVRHLIESAGVPHTEVEVVLVNGASVTLQQRVSDGDRISIYPVFESFDISPLLRLRSQPLRQPRFLADAHLGRLAGYLRMLGFDTLYGVDVGDQALVQRSRTEGRTLLTRDRALLMHRDLTHGCYIRSQNPKQQLSYLLQRLDLYRLLQPFSRCIRCNGLLEPVTKERIVERLPNHVRRTQSEFKRCSSCDRVYWPGGHYQRMQQFIRTLTPVRSA